MTADDVITEVRERQTEFHEAERLYWTDPIVASGYGSPEFPELSDFGMTMDGTRGGSMAVASISTEWEQAVCDFLKEEGLGGEG